jgi:hypothetical protein
VCSPRVIDSPGQAGGWVEVPGLRSCARGAFIYVTPRPCVCVSWECLLWSCL